MQEATEGGGIQLSIRGTDLLSIPATQTGLKLNFRASPVLPFSPSFPLSLSSLPLLPLAPHTALLSSVSPSFLLPRSCPASSPQIPPGAARSLWRAIVCQVHNGVIAIGLVLPILQPLVGLVGSCSPRP